MEKQTAIMPQFRRLPNICFKVSLGLEETFPSKPLMFLDLIATMKPKRVNTIEK